ncbi:hypothetical protein U1Q18_004496, partial [Sarracenia purpurea var. burkii]
MSPPFTATILVVALAMAAIGYAPKAADAARAFLVFGDSLVDNGNNYYLATEARADSPPYGIDYPTVPPTAQPAGEHLGSEPTLPYLNPELNGRKLLVGANFASAGIGVLNNTGVQEVVIAAAEGTEVTDLLVEEGTTKLTELVPYDDILNLEGLHRWFWPW